MIKILNFHVVYKRKKFKIYKFFYVKYYYI